MSCASGKRKHGLVRARAPQRSTLEEHAPRTGRSLFAAAAAFAQNGHVRFQRSRENRAADDSPAAGPSSYYVRRQQDAPGAAAERAGAAVAVSKAIFPPFSARDHFESSPRVEIAVLASSARPRQSRKYTTSKEKKKSAPAASGGARNDKTGKTDMVQFLFFGPVNILARATVAH